MFGIWCFHCPGLGFNPQLGNWDPTRLEPQAKQKYNTLWVSEKKSHIMRFYQCLKGQCLCVKFLNIHDIFILFLFLWQAFLEIWCLLCYTSYKNKMENEHSSLWCKGLLLGKNRLAFPWGPWHTQNLFSLISAPPPHSPFCFLAAPRCLQDLSSPIWDWTWAKQ